jgi:transposase
MSEATRAEQIAESAELLSAAEAADVAQDSEKASPPSLHTLADWMRDLIAQERFSDLVDGTVHFVDRIVDLHTNQLRELLRKRARALFGPKSEKISDDQLRLLLDVFCEKAGAASVPPLSGAAAELDEAQPTGDKPSEQSQERRRKARRRSPGYSPALRREPVIVAVPENERACPSCENERGVIGHDESEQLEYHPAQFFVKQIRREKRACAKCRDAVVRAPAPPRVIERGELGTGLVAQVLVAKYLEHMPLYRQRESYKRSEVDLARSTLGDAVAAACAWLQPIARRIRERVLAHDIVSSDDTGIRVLDRNHPQGAKRGHLWPYLADHRFVFFAYTPDRSGSGPQHVLKDFRGYLQVDGYAGYDALFRGEQCPRIEVGCWMHARRRFVEALESGDLRALPVIGQLKALYAIERDAKERALDAEGRRNSRNERSKPLLDELASWMQQMASRAVPKSPLATAIGYAQNRWSALLRFLDDGRLEIDNGEVERLIRLVALGRRNYLFAGSDAGAERAAIAYSVLATCRLHELEPWAYLKDVLEKLAGGWPQRQLDRLLPDAWAAEHPEAQRALRPA